MKRSFSACEASIATAQQPALSQPSKSSARPEPIPSEGGWSYDMYQGAPAKPAAFRPLGPHSN